MPAEPEPVRPILHVLVADDNAIDQAFLVALLSSAGHRVTLAVNGRKTVEAVMQQHLDIILMSIQMPVMDGLQATRHIRALPPPKSQVPIIALTLNALPGATDHYRAAGMDGCLSRPPSAAILFRAIGELTTGGRPRRSATDGMPTLDGSVIEALSAFMSKDQLEALLTDSMADIEARVRRLEAHIRTAHGINAAREAHDLVSIAGNCGALALSALARDIERACKQGAIEDATWLFTRMNATATNAIRAIANQIADMAKQRA